VTVVFFASFAHPFAPFNHRLVGRSAASSERNNVRVSRTPKTDVATVSARTVDRNSHYRQSSATPPPPPSNGSLGNLFQRYLIFLFSFLPRAKKSIISFVYSRYTSYNEREREKVSDFLRLWLDRVKFSDG